MILLHRFTNKLRITRGIPRWMTRVRSTLQSCEDEAGPETLAGKFDWKKAEKVWSKIISVKNFDELPDFVKGDRDAAYGFTDLQAIQRVGQQGEFLSKSTKYTRHRTYAIQIGYMGSAYEYGYQRQRVEPEPRTVELDIYAAIQETQALGSFRRVITIAGRTDKYVSAVSQIFNFVHSDAINPAELLDKLRQTRPATSGRLIFHDCTRVPRAFNARSSAQWRRYLYLVPLELKSTTPAAAAAEGVHSLPQTVDVDFVNEVFRRLEGLELPYNSFAVGENRKAGEGLQDLCTLYRARAFEVNPDMDGNASHTVGNVSGAGDNSRRFMCVELVGSRFLRRMVRLLVSTAVREAVEKAAADRNVNIIYDIAMSNDRLRRALPFPGSGLCFSGCGYDVRSLAFYKQQRKVDADHVREQFARDDVLQLQGQGQGQGQGRVEEQRARIEG